MEIMEKTFKILSIAIIAMILLSIGNVVNADQGLPAKYVRLAIPLAQDFVKNDETYAYDGIESSLTIEAIDPQECGSCMLQACGSPMELKYKVKFDCLHTGYGDRTGKYLGQAITKHEAIVTVENFCVTNAIMDDRWDMINEKIIKKPEP
jgi:hypothetical protein